MEPVSEACHLHWSFHFLPKILSIFTKKQKIIMPWPIPNITAANLLFGDFSLPQETPVQEPEELKNTHGTNTVKKSKKSTTHTLHLFNGINSRTSIPIGNGPAIDKYSEQLLEYSSSASKQLGNALLDTGKKVTSRALAHFTTNAIIYYAAAAVLRACYELRL